MTDKPIPQAPIGEFVMFSSDDGKVRIECRFEGDTLWLSQAMLCELFGKAKATISGHIKHIFTEGELDEDSVVRFYRTTAADGKSYNVQFFSLPLVLAVGYRVRSVRGTQFRKWATRTLEEYVVKGFVMDDEYLRGRIQMLKMLRAEYERYASAQRLIKEQQGERDISTLLNWQKAHRNKDKP